jgi:PhzF family phenazine biosynthesis protein
MNLEIYQVDSFTSELFKGNPAAVVFLDEFLPKELMQNIALEMNLSETAFVVHKEGRSQIRFYTPSHEAILCGHASLAAAHLSMQLGWKSSAFIFEAREDEIRIDYEGERVLMNMPIYKLEKRECTKAQREQLGFEPLAFFETSKNWRLAIAPDEEQVLQFSPESEAMIQLDLGHLMLCARSSSNSYDVISRCFAPEMGILEDPVTGSSMCALVPYWTKVLGQDRIVVNQASKRGGIIQGTAYDNRVGVSGEAVTVFKATIQL